MARPDQRRQIFDYTPAQLEPFTAGQPTSAGQLDAMRETIELHHPQGVHPPEQVDPLRSSGRARMGVVRGWENDDDDTMMMSMMVRDGERKVWIFPQSEAVEVVCSPGLTAKDYELVQFIGPGDLQYPSDVPKQIAVTAMPVLPVGPDLVALWLPSIIPVIVPGNLRATEGFVIDGAGRVGFRVTP